VKIAEPLLFWGEFGQRKANYSRPVSLDFNRSKAHDIVMAPSRHLLPPAVTMFAQFTVPQDVPAFTEATVAAASRKRTRPRTHNSRRPADLPTPLSCALHVHNATNSLTRNISRICTDSPRQTTEGDVSLVHIDIPRIYATISHQHGDTSAFPFSDIPRVHIEISRQPSGSFPVANSLSDAEDTSSPNASETSREPTTVIPQSTETVQSGDSSRQYADTSPPADIARLLSDEFTKSSSRNEQPFLSDESEAAEEVPVGKSPADDGYASPRRDSNRNSASEPFARNTKDGAAAEQTGRGDGKERATARSRHEYDELQLTAAETAYYKRRQLRKPAMILGSNGECPVVPGIRQKARGIWSEVLKG
jgi:hypothetical protein